MKYSAIMKAYSGLFAALFVIAAIMMSGCAQADRVVGCGGFVEVSKALDSVRPGDVDLQVVKVELQSPEGSVKDATECAPNGYYFLPIYEKAHSLKLHIHGPEGWSFTPSTHTIDGGKCDKDYNFLLTGFTVTGKVVGSIEEGADGHGPDGVVVELRRKGTDTDERRITRTVAGGAYTFASVLPGTYAVIASHPAWQFSTGEAEVEIGWGNAVVKTPLVVEGYSVSGQVNSIDGEAIGDVLFLLYADGKTTTIKQINNCSTTSLTGVQLPEDKDLGQPLCAVRSDKSGRFLFNNVPYGKYNVVPLYESTRTTFDVAPSSQTVSVTQGDFVVKEPFKVVGFSVLGRVVSDGKPVEGATVLVDGQERTVSDAQGFFRLDKISVSAKTHDIEATKEHLFFDSLLNYKLSPANPRLPDLNVTSYHVCGRLHVDTRPSETPATVQREIILRPIGDAGKEERRSTDPAGNFCFEAQPGSYKLFPHVTPEEQKSGLVFGPADLSIEVTNAPVLNSNFFQALLSVSGLIRCIETPCDPSISVTLIAKNRSFRVTTGLGIAPTGVIGDEPSDNNQDYFVFRDVLPGQYEVQVNRENWCWDSQTHTVDIQPKNAKGDGKSSVVFIPEFVQSGFILSTVVSYDVNFLLFHENPAQEQKTFNVTKGPNRFCLKSPGVYTLIPRSCYKFEQDAYKYDTSAPHLVDLTVTHFRVNGSVVIHMPPPAADISVQLTYNKKKTEAATIEKTSETNTSTEYKWWAWAAADDTIVIKPQEDSVKEGEGLLFYPASQTLTLHKPECPPPVAAFSARPGQYVRGSIKPAIKGVKISVISTTANTVLVSTQTNADGAYVVGPLYEDAPYYLAAEKEGYVIKADKEDKTLFSARKLALIRVNVFEKKRPRSSATDADATQAQEQEVGLGSVLISLSGTGYRNNNHTDNDGVLVYNGLEAGDYFLRPLLKEYVFAPTSMSIKIGEGEEKEVRLQGTRVAYSVYGSVRALNGEPEKSVSVRVASLPDATTTFSDEVNTDAAGNFRIRGLQPRTSYFAELRTGIDRGIDRASPVNYTIKVTDSDVENVNFLVFRRPSKALLTGHVDAPADILATGKLWVELYKQDDRDTTISRIGLGPAGFFDFGWQQPDDYRVRVGTSLSRRQHAFAPAESTFSLRLPSHHVVLPFVTISTTPAPAGPDASAYNISLLSLVLAIILVVLALNYQFVMQLLGLSYQKAYTDNAAPSTTTSAKKRKQN